MESNELDRERRYKSLWKFLKKKDIASIAISSDALAKVRESQDRFINVIEDILVGVGEIDFLGYGLVEGLTVRVTDDEGGKRVVVTSEIDDRVSRAMGYLESPEAGDRFRELKDAIEDRGIIGYRVDVDAITPSLVSEIRERQSEGGNNRFIFYSSSGRPEAEIETFLRQKQLRQDDTDGIEHYITIVAPQKMKEVKDRGDLEADYYLSLPYMAGGITYIAQDIVNNEGDFDRMSDISKEILLNFWGIIMGEEIGKDFIEKLIRGYWDQILPAIERLTDSLNNARIQGALTDMMA